jgi:predicted RNA-binding Zn-ribbon protein involved in translation (DUF1610 family)
MGGASACHPGEMRYLNAMKPETDTTLDLEETRDFELPGGCILCGGDLAVRMTEGQAASYCPSCRWVSRPHMRREDGHVYVTHPAGGVA